VKSWESHQPKLNQNQSNHKENHEIQTKSTFYLRINCIVDHDIRVRLIEKTHDKIAELEKIAVIDEKLAKGVTVGVGAVPAPVEVIEEPIIDESPVLEELINP